MGLSITDFSPVLLSEHPICDTCYRDYLDAACDEVFYRSIIGATNDDGEDCGGLVWCQTCMRTEMSPRSGEK